MKGSISPIPKAANNLRRDVHCERRVMREAPPPHSIILIYRKPLRSITNRLEDRFALRSNFFGVFHFGRSGRLCNGLVSNQRTAPPGRCLSHRPQQRGTSLASSVGGTVRPSIPALRHFSLAQGRVEALLGLLHPQVSRRIPIRNHRH